MHQFVDCVDDFGDNFMQFCASFSDFKNLNGKIDKTENWLRFLGDSVIFPTLPLLICHHFGSKNTYKFHTVLLCQLAKFVHVPLKSCTVSFFV